MLLVRVRLWFGVEGVIREAVGGFWGLQWRQWRKSDWAAEFVVGVLSRPRACRAFATSVVEQGFKNMDAICSRGLVSWRGLSRRKASMRTR